MSSMSDSQFTKNIHQVIDEELIRLRKNKRRREAIAYLTPVVFVCFLTLSILVYLSFNVP